jgi:hypothetical protein
MFSSLKGDDEDFGQNLYKEWGVTGLESNLAKFLNRDID